MKKAVFLDRDGVINHDSGYVYQPEAFNFIPGVFEACARLQRLGYTLVMVTNQSGIARGYYTEDDFHHLTEWMLKAFKQKGVGIAGVYFSPYLPNATVTRYRQDSDCRKPKPGMLLQAADELDLDLASSLMVGDKVSDLEAAEAAGLAYAVFIGDKPLPGQSQHLSIPWQCKPSLKDFVDSLSD